MPGSHVVVFIILEPRSTLLPTNGWRLCGSLRKSSCIGPCIKDNGGNRGRGRDAGESYMGNIRLETKDIGRCRGFVVRWFVFFGVYMVCVGWLYDVLSIVSELHIVIFY